MSRWSSNGEIRLSAALIVKNEERFLGDCLRSIRDVVDEIVVVDTGSTDRTRHIARNLGARLYDFPWVDDFSAARNHALDRARGAWILYIDADERLRPCDVEGLHADLSDAAHVAYNVLLHARPDVTPYWEMRLFRNAPEIRFRGVMHESIWPGIDAYRVGHGGRVGQTGLVLDHLGYEGDQERKHRRNLPLLVRALRQDPGRVYLLCHLATVCLAQGRQPLAERAWRIALEMVRRKRGHRLLPEDSLPYTSLISWQLAIGHNPDALLSEAEERFPAHQQLKWLRGVALARAGRLAEAIAVFESLVGSADDSDRSIGYDTRLFGEWPLEALATCHFKLGRYAEAARLFERAGACRPDSIEYWVKRALCLHLAGPDIGRPAPAFSA